MAQQRGTRQLQSASTAVFEGREGAEYRIHANWLAEDPEWDDFVSSVPAGRHVQSSLWCRAKETLGWQTVRVVAVSDGRVVGGAQVLLKSLPIGGFVGYVPRGPLMAANDVRLARLLLDGLRRIANSHRIIYLALRPPAGPDALLSQLEPAGFLPAVVETRIDPLATVIVDLTRSPDEILAGMHSKTRYNIRLAEKKGVRVYEGGEEDLAVFYDLLSSTGERQGFTSNSLEYYRHMWRLFSPGERIKLFLAEYDGQPLSGMLALAYGDTVTYWRGAWCGTHGNVHPNEAMHWAAIRWARSRGYRRYDLEGIDWDVAVAVSEDREISRGELPSVSRFKLGFGGRVELFPATHDYTPNRLLRGLYRNVVGRVLKRELAVRLVNALRGTQAG